MAGGPWEDYRQESSGPWDDYKNTAKSIRDLQNPADLKMDELTYSPTVGMSSAERGMAGFQKGAKNIVRGTRQLLPSFMGGMSKGEYDETKKLDAPLMRTTAGQVGEVAGSILPALPLSMMPGANTILGAGLYGAGFGGLQPADSGMERAVNTGLSAVGSAGTMAIARGGPAFYQGVVSPFTKGGSERIALDTINRFARNPNSWQTASTRELIPGSTPSLAEISGDPGLAQLQRAAKVASEGSSSAMAERDAVRLAARKQAVADIAGTHDDRLMYEETRKANADMLYKKAFNAPFTDKAVARAAPAIEEIFGRDSVQKARQAAGTRAREEGVILTPEDLSQPSLKGMHYMKMDLDSQISAAKQAGDKNLVRLLMGTKEKFTGIMQTLSKPYAKALAQYEADSRPINAMDVGKEFYEKLVPALTDVGGVRLTPSAYATLLRKGDEAAAQATGFKGAKLKDILSTDQMNTLINLGLDLGRDAGAQQVGMMPGSPSAQYLTGGNALRQVIGPLGLPAGWGEGTFAKTVGGRALSAIARPAENRVQDVLGNFIINPSEAQAAASRAALKRARLAPLSKIADTLLPPSALAPAEMLRLLRNSGQE